MATPRPSHGATVLVDLGIVLTCAYTAAVSTRTTAALIVAVALGVTGCASDDTGDTASGDATAVTTTTVWGSIADQIVACAGIGSNQTLMPVGADPHDYEPSSTDVASMVGAGLVVANGLGLEEGLESALESAEADGANIQEVAPQLDPIPFGEGGHSHSEDEHSDEEHSGAEEHSDEEHSGEDHSEEALSEEGDGHEHSGDDPHVWMDMARVATAAEIIGAQLSDQTGDSAYEDCGSEVAADILAVEEDVVATMAVIPEEDRILVTDHDSLAYFAEAYNFAVAGVVVPGGSTLAEPSSAELAELTEVIEETGVPAIFVNTASPTDLADALANEVGEIAIVPLYIGSVGGPDSGAESYQDMMTTNAAAIADALA